MKVSVERVEVSCTMSGMPDTKLSDDEELFNILCICFEGI